MLYDSIGATDSEWAGKPYAEIREVADRDGSVLVVPVGSIEQHGHHLPVATDTILVDAVVHGGTEQTGADVPVLVTPTVWTGFSPHHLSFGGTLSLELDHLRAVLEDVALTGIQNGFDAVCFVNGHGGNAALVDAVVSTVGTETDAEVLGTTYFTLATDEVGALRDSEDGGMAHGGEYETSLMLHLRPDLVADPAKREGTLWDEHYEWSGGDLLDGGPVSVYRSFDEYSESGAIGAPELASAEKGARIYDAVTSELAALLVAIHEHNA
ncbi:creatininase family protein [Halomicrobium sp. LC1Hm]|uniref:creatininase family protein n=1 Tax=Halomicrobium sp. LC1Hm TaxID=2610902 RepID=UPI0012983DB4|nr:creatininase family protein [Halomicrobium sp. LC1Hm]QGA81108.1 Creatinine amidohydrolase/Fe(II)-dependent formamide hydrolase involved in riboflavin and F420 biosynthesis [Halomicrobium sp. LC1Hm]